MTRHAGASQDQIQMVSLCLIYFGCAFSNLSVAAKPAGVHRWPMTFKTLLLGLLFWLVCSITVGLLVGAKIRFGQKSKRATPEEPRPSSESERQ
jgi:uncharacterized membrane protein YidH (DUF202 family)